MQEYGGQAKHRRDCCECGFVSWECLYKVLLRDKYIFLCGATSRSRGLKSESVSHVFWVRGNMRICHGWELDIGAVVEAGFGLGLFCSYDLMVSKFDIELDTEVIHGNSICIYA